MPKAEGVPRRQNEQLTIASAYSRVDSEVDLVQFNHEGHINAILEEEEEVISAHRKEVEDTMEIVREVINSTCQWELLQIGGLEV
jgi:kinesin family protein 2/24